MLITNGIGSIILLIPIILIVSLISKIMPPDILLDNDIAELVILSLWQIFFYYVLKKDFYGKKYYAIKTISLYFGNIILGLPITLNFAALILAGH